MTDGLLELESVSATDDVAILNMSEDDLKNPELVEESDDTDDEHEEESDDSERFEDFNDSLEDDESDDDDEEDDDDDLDDDLDEEDEEDEQLKRIKELEAENARLKNPEQKPITHNLKPIEDSIKSLSSEINSIVERANKIKETNPSEYAELLVAYNEKKSHYDNAQYELEVRSAENVVNYHVAPWGTMEEDLKETLISDGATKEQLQEFFNGKNRFSYGKAYLVQLHKRAKERASLRQLVPMADKLQQVVLDYIETYGESELIKELKAGRTPSRTKNKKKKKYKAEADKVAQSVRKVSSKPTKKNKSKIPSDIEIAHMDTEDLKKDLKNTLGFY